MMVVLFFVVAVMGTFVVLMKRVVDCSSQNQRTNKL